MPKVCGPYVVTLLNWTPVFEWCTAQPVVVDGRQNTNTFLGLIDNIIGEVYVIT